MHKPPRISPVLALIGPLLAAACSPAPERVPADLVLRNVTLIDGTGAEARANVDVFVRDGLIAAVLPNGSAEIPADADVVEGEGSFVMPGLADMHVHFSLGLPAPRRPGETDEVLGRLLYYGVTSVLNLGASEG
ncbi:MAG: hypothetical protein KC645_19550, partial [Gemmatimonadetes bacterium]|nr:hypothetical protein [Gemmatimonadota bacterium]